MQLNNFGKAMALLSGFIAACFYINAEKVVFLHTNDTHSTIEPLPDGTGGILQRKAIIDSVKKAEDNIIVIDAGDIVQGTLYFKYFGGDVEYPLMNMTGYDYRVLGNHEFDNGMDALAHYYKGSESVPLSANYDFSNTVLDGVFKKYDIREIGDKKIGFFGINIDPSSIIAHKNIDVNFTDPIKAANETASLLKNELGCDLVVAITHIGYEKVNEKPTDVDIATQSRDIDIIIGGHSHTLIDPRYPEIFPSLIANADGKLVRVVQVGKQGKFVGKITVDLDKTSEGDGTDWHYELIPVTNRFPQETLDAEMIEFLKPYRESVDSVNNKIIAWAAFDFPKERTGALPNLTADFGKWYAQCLADSVRQSGKEFPAVDFAIMNVGGIRDEIPAGKITEGEVLSIYPFSNNFVIIAVKGADIIEAMKVAARKGGEAVSSEIKVITDENGKLLHVLHNYKEIDPEREYVIGTIDYVAEGNDDLVSLANHRKLLETDKEVSVPILEWIKLQARYGLPLMPDPESRFVKTIDFTEVK